MLTIKIIRVRFDRKIVPTKISHILIGYHEDFQSTQTKPTILDAHTLEWNQKIIMPLLYNMPIRIQFHVPVTSSNPEESLLAETTFYSELKITDNSQSVVEGTVFDSHARKIGIVQIGCRIVYGESLIREDRNCLVVSSVLAHLNHTDGEKGFIQLAVNGQSICTPAIQIIAGELLWADVMVLNLTRDNTKLQKNHIQLLSNAGSVPAGQNSRDKLALAIFVDEIRVGESIIDLFSLKKSRKTTKYKRLEILDPNTKAAIGTLFLDIDYKVKQEPVKNIENRVQTDVKNYEQRNSQLSSVSKLPVLQQSSTKNLTKNYRNSRSESRLSKPMEESRFKRREYDFYGAVFNLGEFNKDTVKQMLKRKNNKRPANNVKLPAIQPN